MESNEAMKAMALAIVKAHYPEMPADYRGRRYQIALAAIMETQEACAKLAESELVEVYGDSPEIDTECNHLVRRIATAIRTGEHYVLAGERAALSAAIGEPEGALRNPDD